MTLLLAYATTTSAGWRPTDAVSRANVTYCVHGQAAAKLADSRARTSAGFWLGEVNAPLPTEAKKIVKI